MTGGSAAAVVSDRPLAVRFERLAGYLSLELSLQQRRSRPTRKAIAVCSASDGLSRRMPWRLSKRSQNTGFAVPPEPQTPVKDAA